MRGFKATFLIVLLACCGFGASAADLRIGVASEVTTLDPHFFHLTSNTEIHKGLYSGLITQDADMKIVPDLAVSWRTLDPTHWEFKLRPGVVFHDGTPFTADDVVFTYERARSVPNSPGSFLQYLKHVTKTAAPDPLTVLVETDGPDPILLNELQNVWIVSRKNGAGAATVDYNSGKAAVGTGPYRLVSWRPGEPIVLRRFDQYFGPKSDWDTVTYRAITNDAARTAALLSGDVDLISAVPGPDLAAVRANPALAVATMQSNRCFFWSVDVDRNDSPAVTDNDGKPMPRNPLKDVRVRRAMSKALDRDALVSRVMQGQAVAASQFMPDGVPGTSTRLKPEPYDLEGAKKLLAEAGYPKGFGLAIASTNDRYINDAAMTQAVAQMWSRLGLKITVNAMPKALYFPRAVKLEFSVLLSGNSTDTSEPLSQLTYLLGTFNAAKGIGAGNYGRYSNLALDQLLARASAELDDEKRAGIIAQAYELALGEDVAAIPMLFQITAWGMRKGITYGGFPQDATVAALVRGRP
ncbi:MAG: peptide/nickel transport system substrate-binding protein [Acetobacteraceae bacterium]|nr:peptide/nickel transport system substrate-binding protein [Acetobacteraceae bacterium]